MRRFLLAATAATILSALLCTAFLPSHPGPLPHGYMPLLAAELVASGAEIEQVYGTDAQAGRCGGAVTSAQPWDCSFVSMLRRNTWADFLFIASYVTVYFLIGRLLGRGLGTIVILLGVLAGLADIAENIGILRATAEPASDLLAWAIRGPSLIKWVATSLVLILVFRFFVGPGLSRDSPWAWRLTELATGTLYAASGLICLYGVALSDPMIAAGLQLLGLPLLLQQLILWRDDGLLRRHGLSRNA